VYYFSIVALVILADQFSKIQVLKTLQLYESREIIPGFFNLVYVTNTGAAFSMLADVDSPWRHWFFLIVGIVAIIGLSIAWYRFRDDHFLYGIALAMIAGGAAGNLIDRVRYGSVVDFLDFTLGSYHWPAFNVADSAICVGVGLFILGNILDARQQKHRSRE
jgi:signal peptidase II